MTTTPPSTPDSRPSSASAWRRARRALEAPPTPVSDPADLALVLFGQVLRGEFDRLLRGLHMPPLDDTDASGRYSDLLDQVARVEREGARAVRCDPYEPHTLGRRLARQAVAAWLRQRAEAIEALGDEAA